MRGDGAEELYGEGTPLLARFNSIGFAVEGTWSVSVAALLPVECNLDGNDEDDDDGDGGGGDSGAFIDCEISEYRCASDFGDAFAALWLLLLQRDGCVAGSVDTAAAGGSPAAAATSTRNACSRRCLFAFSASVALWQKTRISVAA